MSAESGPIVLVTGGNQGIGFAVVESVAAKGAFVLIGCRNIERGHEALNKITQANGKGAVVQLDVLSDESIRNAAETIEKEYGRLDVLVNNAGVYLVPKPDGSNKREIFDASFSTNVTSVVVVTDAFLPLMIKSSQDPRVINVSSGLGSITLNDKFPPMVYTSYAASKAALNLLTAEYAKKYKDQVHFHSVSPGLCRTSLSSFREGAKDASDGAKVIVELGLGKNNYGTGGFWQIEGTNPEPERVPW